MTQLAKAGLIEGCKKSGGFVRENGDTLALSIACLIFLYFEYWCVDLFIGVDL